MLPGRLKVCGFGAAFVILALLLNCAQPEPPSGGPPDKTPPRLASSVPLSGATNVGQVKNVLLQFSKPMQEGTGSQVFISPHPAKPPKLRWRGDRLEVVMPESLNANQTYVVQVSATVSDLRGNKLDSSVIVAFSTGPSIDSGRISGQVWQKGTPQEGASVALYPVNGDTDSLNYDSLNVDYMTVSNQRGRFDLRFLSPHRYRLVAFTDKNKNDRFNPKTEPFAVTDRPTIVGGEEPLNDLILELTSVDTSKLQIITAVYSQNKLIRVRLTREITVQYLSSHLGAAQLVDSADTSHLYALRAFAESEDSSTTGLSLDFGNVPDGIYRLSVPYDSLTPPLELARVSVKGVQDKEPPTVVSWLPGKQPRFAKDVVIGLTFSEPIDTSKFMQGVIILVHNDKDTLPLMASWPDPFHVHVKTDALKNGANYRLDIKGVGIVDPAGNMMADTLRSYKFNTLSTDSLGTISGKLSVQIAGKENDPVVLEFKDIVANYQYHLPVTGREFRMDIPAGRYVLSGFVDSNRDGIHGYGSVTPFRYAESQASYQDTIVVRARFETTGIEFTFK